MAHWRTYTTFNRTSVAYIFGQCKTVDELKAAYEKRKNLNNQDTVKKHYFRNMQRLLLGEVVQEELAHRPKPPKFSIH